MSNVTVLPFSAQAKYQNILTSRGLDRALVLDVDKVRTRLNLLRKYLPTVTPYFAIKSAPHESLIKELHKHGCKFDLATNGEIDMVRSIGVNSEDTIHTHPIKTQADIEYSLQYGCNIFVVDNVDEIQKFIPYKQAAKLLLRLSFPNPEAAVDLSRKFGCVPDKAPELIEYCNTLGLNVIGLSFHVGSQVKTHNKHVEAIQCCLPLIKKYNLSILDIGGGFPVDYYQQNPDLDSFFEPIRCQLENVKDIKVISEPGRFISGPCYTCISTIVGVSDRTDARWYYLNDGVYGSYSGVLFDHIEYNMNVFSDSHQCQTSVLTGPTCDSIDVIVKQALLPKLNIGDLVVGHNMGSYTFATATQFNCIKPPQIIDIYGGF